jgi:hypothetical protein
MLGGDTPAAGGAPLRSGKKYQAREIGMGDL